MWDECNSMVPTQHEQSYKGLDFSSLIYAGRSKVPARFQTRIPSTVSCHDLLYFSVVAYQKLLKLSKVTRGIESKGWDRIPSRKHTRE